MSNVNYVSHENLEYFKGKIEALIPNETTVSSWGFTKNEGTITGIKMNGASKGTSGVVDLGTVITSLSGYATETWVGEQGYITGITSAMVTTALGYTPPTADTWRGIKTKGGVDYIHSSEFSDADSISSNFLRFWNGRVSGGVSNLQYCDRGRFGTIVTASSGDYLPTSGGNYSVTIGAATTSSNKTLTVNGKVVVNPSYNTASNSYNEGVRINQASNGWAEVLLGAAAGTTEGQPAAGWIIGRRGENGSKSGSIGDLTIEYNNAIGTGLTLYANGNRPTWNAKGLAYTSEIPSLTYYVPSSDGPSYSSVGTSYLGGVAGNPSIGGWSWTSLVRAEHRNGQGDGPNYVMEIASNMVGDSGLYWRKWWSGGSRGWSMLIDSNSIGSQSVNYATTAGSAPASDVYAWAKASTAPITTRFHNVTLTGNISGVGGFVLCCQMAEHNEGAFGSSSSFATYMYNKGLSHAIAASGYIEYGGEYHSIYSVSSYNTSSVYIRAIRRGTREILGYAVSGTIQDTVI